VGGHPPGVLDILLHHIDHLRLIVHSGHRIFGELVGHRRHGAVDHEQPAAGDVGRVVIGMPLLEALPVDEHTAQWPVWGTTARVVVTEPGALADVRALVVAELAAVDKACSRFRDDSELARVRAAHGRPVRVSPLLAALVSTALDAAARTGGRVDPTVGNALVRLGYDRDFRFAHATDGWRVEAGPAPGWQRIRLCGTTLAVPPDVLVDLGSTGKAYAADRCATLAAQRFGVGVMVSLGGDIATAGRAPEGGWCVLVQDGPDEPSCVVALRPGTALATSSTRSRRWGGVHHILDPRTCRPAQPVWRTVSVTATDCVTANALTTGAIVAAADAPDWLDGFGVPARLVRADGRVLRLGGWPA
jgi:FAD:protein FMN transferase